MEYHDIHYQEYHGILYTLSDIPWHTMHYQASYQDYAVTGEISILPCTKLEFDLSTGFKVGKNNALPVLMPSGELSSFVGGVCQFLHQQQPFKVCSVHWIGNLIRYIRYKHVRSIECSLTVHGYLDDSMGLVEFVDFRTN